MYSVTNNGACLVLDTASATILSTNKVLEVLPLFGLYEI